MMTFKIVLLILFKYFVKLDQNMGPKYFKKFMPIYVLIYQLQNFISLKKLC